MRSRFALSFVTLTLSQFLVSHAIRGAESDDKRQKIQAAIKKGSDYLLGLYKPDAVVPQGENAHWENCFGWVGIVGKWC